MKERKLAIQKFDYVENKKVFLDKIKAFFTILTNTFCLSDIEK